MTVERFFTKYLGDGVYASFDGWQVWLHVGNREAPPVVALEPAVINALNAYFRNMHRREAKRLASDDERAPHPATLWPAGKGDTE
jgi:hypothetical protein